MGRGAFFFARLIAWRWLASRSGNGRLKPAARLWFRTSSFPTSRPIQQVSPGCGEIAPLTPTNRR